MGQGGSDETYYGRPAPPAARTCRRVRYVSSFNRSGGTVRPVSDCVLLPDLEQ
ncbi:hypothetical protein GCM10010440_08730 [Kitasatospora cinereorecta]